MRLQPQQFWRRQARHGQAARHIRICGIVARQAGRFGLGARIVPQDGGTDHGIVGVEQHGAVHLARQADAGDAGIVLRPARAQLAQRVDAGGPPVLRRLFGPACLRAAGVDAHGRLAAHAARAVHQHGFQFGGTEVDTEGNRWMHGVSICKGQGQPQELRTRKVGDKRCTCWAMPGLAIRSIRRSTAMAPSSSSGCAITVRRGLK
ncbi:hypothetical protein JANLI_04330 [Janthinobacterium lividum]|nr:hypothetical protein JANLI_04330 [Janthinobacterium lividum]